MLKTYELRVKGIMGIIFSPGRILAETEEEALTRARKEWGVSAEIFEARADERISSVEDLIDMENQLTHNRLNTPKFVL